jgi:predicted RNase H-like HicB family nuclease
VQPFEQSKNGHGTNPSVYFLRVPSVRALTTIRLPFTIKKDGRLFVSCCPLLDVYSQGRTRHKAIENLGDALQLFLMSCHERGTLRSVLKRRTRKLGPKPLGTLSVPLPFLVESERKECPA